MRAGKGRHQRADEVGPAMRPPELSDRAKAVEEAYLRYLAWQARRARALNDRHERLIDAQEQTGVFLLQAHSKASIETYLTDKVEAARRKKRRF